MTDRTKTSLVRWAPTIVSALALAGTLALGAMQSTASASVAPLTARVSVLESQRKDDVARLDRIEQKIDRVDGKIDHVAAVLARQ